MAHSMIESGALQKPLDPEILAANKQELLIVQKQEEFTEFFKELLESSLKHYKTLVPVAPDPDEHEILRV